ncbi:hypothetical protein GCM10025868_38230 [Angustibacter aerolatus]|uniref:Solute-binding protein family 3/N-terminal domain-containing protein n=1 Tax=Angustibacter aerolatus TaxID=1162965 RepID=A0ABQ6JK43_9ACTN|nr:transporter substrate-binding domain-containing protein [Angustibacter aerolatus]GMA88573.1 hypothetical protein GCM10025868_38230 [Angustibacter aerolatus]
MRSPSAPRARTRRSRSTTPRRTSLTGYDVEIARAVAKQAGKEAKFNEVTFDTIFAGMQAKRFDMIANQVTVNPEREKLYSFSTPYTVSTAVVVTRSDDDSVKTLADVKGKRSPQSATSSFNDFAKAAGAKPYTVEGFTQAVAEPEAEARAHHVQRLARGARLPEEHR